MLGRDCTATCKTVVEQTVMDTVRHKHEQAMTNSEVCRSSPILTNLKTSLYSNEN